MRRSAIPTVILALAALAGAGGTGSAAAQTIQVKPEAVGLARQLLGTRSATPGVPEELPLSGMVPAEADDPDAEGVTEPKVGTRATALNPVQPTTSLSINNPNLFDSGYCSRLRSDSLGSVPPTLEAGDNAACTCSIPGRSPARVSFIAAGFGMNNVPGFCTQTCRSLRVSNATFSCQLAWKPDPNAWSGTIRTENTTLATLSGGTLTLNTGRNAAKRGGVGARDGSEHFVLSARGADVVITHASVDGTTLGPLPQNFSGVTSIVAYPGAGDDTFDLSDVDPVIQISIQAEAGIDRVIAPDPARFAANQAGVQTPSTWEEGVDTATTLYEMFQNQNLSGPDLESLRRERAEREKEFETRLREMQERAKQVDGPSALGAVNLLEALHVDPGVQLYQSDVLELHHEVYADANPLSGRFYYLPKRYDLSWDPENQYGMTVIYGLGDQKEEGEVYMAARLASGVNANELAAAKTLIAAYIQRHSTPENPIRFRGLFPLPLENTSDIELFGGASNEFTVPKDKLSVQGVSGLLGELDVSWAMDVRRVLNLESLLRTDAGIHGTVTFHAAGEEDFRRAIPLEISVASPRTFRRIPFDRKAGWQNQTLYPIQLARLHALVMNPKDQGVIRKHDPVVYTWDLGGARVEPGGRVDWDAAQVPAWIDEGATMIWATYTVESDCESCDDQVFTEKFIPSQPSARDIVFTTGDAFEATGAYRISVHVRSPFFDPKRARILEPPAVQLGGDDSETTIARLYLTDRELTGEGASQPLYEYKLVVGMRDGTTYETSSWIPTRDLDYLLGSVAIEQHIGHIPAPGKP